MMKINTLTAHQVPATQKGMVLIVGLVMVLLLTIIGLAAIRGSGLQESMAANMRETNIAFQASESGLRVCESNLNPSKSLPATFTCGSSADLNLTPANSVINNNAFWLTQAAPLTVENTKLASNPNGLIERLFVDKLAYGALHGAAVGMQANKNQLAIDSYRVTVEGVGVSDRTNIILQTTYNR